MHRPIIEEFSPMRQNLKYVINFDVVLPRDDGNIYNKRETPEKYDNRRFSIRVKAYRVDSHINQTSAISSSLLLGLLMPGKMGDVRLRHSSISIRNKDLSDTNEEDVRRILT